MSKKIIGPADRGWSSLPDRKKLHNLQKLQARGSLDSTHQALLAELQEQAARRQADIPTVTVSREAQNKLHQATPSTNLERFLLSKEALTQLENDFNNSNRQTFEPNANYTVINSAEDFSTQVAALAKSVAEETNTPLSVDYTSPDLSKYKKIAVVVADWHDSGGVRWADHQDSILVANAKFITRLNELSPSQYLLSEGVEIDRYKSDPNLSIEQSIDKQDTMLSTIITRLKTTPALAVEAQSSSLALKSLVANLLMQTQYALLKSDSDTTAVGYLLHQIAVAIDRDPMTKKLYEVYIAMYAEENKLDLEFMPFRLDNSKICQILVPSVAGMKQSSLFEVAGGVEALNEQREKAAAKFVQQNIPERSYSTLIFGGNHRETLYKSLEDEGIGVIAVRAFDHQAEMDKYEDEIKTIIADVAKSNPGRAEALMANIWLNKVVGAEITEILSLLKQATQRG